MCKQDSLGAKEEGGAIPPKAFEFLKGFKEFYIHLLLDTQVLSPTSAEMVSLKTLFTLSEDVSCQPEDSELYRMADTFRQRCERGIQRLEEVCDFSAYGIAGGHPNAAYDEARKPMNLIERKSGKLIDASQKFEKRKKMVRLILQKEFV